MPINPDSLGQALDRLEPSDWARFEKLCHAFFASEFGDLYRSTASPSGDEGRDAELFSPDGRSSVVLQFSVQSDWRAKIRATLARLKEKHRKITVLIYVTNRQIGAMADDIKAELRGKPLLDIRDRDWFTSRVNLDENRARSAQSLYDALVAPTVNESMQHKSSNSLTSDQSRTLLFFLELQHDDEISDKGFTKSCFETLVCAAVRHTTSAVPLRLDEIYERVSHLLPQHDLESQLKQYIDGALKRLINKGTIKHNQTTSVYHLSNEQHERLVEKVREIESLRRGFLDDLEDDISSDARVDSADVAKTREYMANVIELYLHNRGEAFASAVVSGSSLMDDESELTNAIAKTSPTPRLKTRENVASVCHSIVKTFLRTPSDKTLAYLKLLSDCYTLFAFLAAAPDVQKVTKKLFDDGEIWLDTSVLLPALSNWQHLSLKEKPTNPFRLLFRQLKNSGLRLFVSGGVIEETLSHLNRCVAFARADHWTSDVPYVAAQFLLAGGSKSSIPSFLEEFRGPHNPEADLAEFLDEELGIKVHDLESTDALPPAVRDEVVDYWQRAKEKRRAVWLDDISVVRLARHDSENYLNVLTRRRLSQQALWQGYTSWWLTLDRSAWRLLDSVSPEVHDFIRHQPVMSLDFLTRYLTFGPIRTRIDRTMANPLELYATEIAETIPLELITAAQKLRNVLGPLSERRKARRIAAALDEQRAEYGRVHTAGLAELPNVTREGVE